MTVYVDNARNPFGRMIMCHMVADTIGELLEMADRLGLDRRHFQPWSHPHFDVSLGYRKTAVSFEQNPAVPVDKHQLVEIMKRQRQQLEDDPLERAAFEAAMKASTKGRRMLVRHRTA